MTRRGNLAINPFTGKIIKRNGHTMSKLEMLASKEPEKFAKKLSELGKINLGLTEVVEYKIKQAEWFKYMQEAALHNRWTELRDRSVFWVKWIFPTDLDLCERLRGDCTYVKNLMECINILIESWGWNHMDRCDLNNIWEGQRWIGDDQDVGIIDRMETTCKLFGIKAHEIVLFFLSRR